MREFKSIGVHHQDGLGEVTTVRLDQDEHRDGLMQKLKDEGGVVVDGTHYIVNGVESFAVYTLRKGALIGLLLSHDY